MNESTDRNEIMGIMLVFSLDPILKAKSCSAYVFRLAQRRVFLPEDNPGIRTLQE